MICQTHNTEFKDYRYKSGAKQGQVYQGHWDSQNNNMCFAPKPMMNSKPVEPSPEEPVREPVKETDWDEVARGKIRSLFIQSHIQRNGLIPLSASDLMTLDALVEVAMGNK